MNPHYIFMSAFVMMGLLGMWIGIRDLRFYGKSPLYKGWPKKHWLSTIGIFKECVPSRCSDFIFITTYEYRVHGNAYYALFGSNVRPPFQSKVILYDPGNPSCSIAKRSYCDGYSGKLMSPTNFLFLIIGSLFVSLPIITPVLDSTHNSNLLTYMLLGFLIFPFAIGFSLISMLLFKDALSSLKVHFRKVNCRRIKADLVHIESNEKKELRQGIYQYIVEGTKYFATKEFPGDPQQRIEVLYNISSPGDEFPVIHQNFLVPFFELGLALYFTHLPASMFIGVIRILIFYLSTGNQLL